MTFCSVIELCLLNNCGRCQLRVPSRSSGQTSELNYCKKFSFARDLGAGKNEKEAVQYSSEVRPLSQGDANGLSSLGESAADAILPLCVDVYMHACKGGEVL
jgi:hypothetical protein